jgi:hypothetical protein
MMKIFILVVMALAVLLLPFRRHLDSREKIVCIVRKHSVITRLSYIGFALLWLFLNKNSVILSEWDAQRLGIPVFWYLSVPALFLLSYAAFPSFITWLLPLTILLLGWFLHVYKSLAYLFFKSEGNADMISILVMALFDVLALAACVFVLYIAGPYLRKRFSMSNCIQQIAEKADPS